MDILKIIYWRNLVLFINKLEKETFTYFISCFKLTPPFLMSSVLNPLLMAIIFSLRYHHTINMYPLYWLCIHFIGYISIVLAMYPLYWLCIHFIGYVSILLAMYPLYWLCIHFIGYISIREILLLFIVSMTSLTLYTFRKLSKFLGSRRTKLK